MSITAVIEANEHAIGSDPGVARVSFKVGGSFVDPPRWICTLALTLKVDEPTLLGGDEGT
jgi:hypothetical protein